MHFFCFLADSLNKFFQTRAFGKLFSIHPSDSNHEICYNPGQEVIFHDEKQSFGFPKIPIRLGISIEEVKSFSAESVCDPHFRHFKELLHCFNIDNPRSVKEYQIFLRGVVSVPDFDLFGEL